MIHVTLIINVIERSVSFVINHQVQQQKYAYIYFFSNRQLTSSNSFRYVLQISTGQKIPIVVKHLCSVLSIVQMKIMQQYASFSIRMISIIR